MSISLDDPDSDDMRVDPNYMGEIAAIIKQGYQLIADGNYIEAIELVSRYVDSAQADAQVMRLHYILALGYIGIAHLGNTDEERERLGEASKALFEALERAITLNDFEAFAVLSSLGGNVHHERQEFDKSRKLIEGAIEAASMSDEVLKEFGDAWQLEHLAVLSGQQFLAGEFDEARATIERARQYIPADREAALAFARVEWHAALVHRWSGKPHDALECAEKALRTFQELDGDGGRIARLHVVLADIEMDIALTFRDGVNRDEYYHRVMHVRPRLADALAGATEAGDDGTIGMALLARARMRRMIDPQTDTRGDLGHADSIAHKTKDLPLLGQVVTACGDELLAHGDSVEAAKMYEQAGFIFEYAQTPALGLWALRALLKIEEQRTKPDADRPEDGFGEQGDN
jgi:tetratricopeptide (TPR) repeat protein